MWIVMTSLMPFRALISRYRPKDAGSNLCIEAGIKGWETISIGELFKSACEHIGTERVHQIKIDKEKSYINQFKEALENYSPNYYLYDPRTGDQNWVAGLWQAIQVAIILYWRRITPIASLTDIGVRLWRTQGCIVTTKTGVAICYSAKSDVQKIFPHSRLIAPNFHAFSQKTMKYSSAKINEKRSGVLFIGSLYEPRTSILKTISEGLAERGITLELKCRPDGAPPLLTEEEYWTSLCNAAIVIALPDQARESIRDWAWIPHFVFRYTETIAAGALLVAPMITGMERYFDPNKHFVSFNSPSHAVDVIEYYMKNEDERKQLAEQGRLRVQTLVNAKTFWMNIDIALGKDAFG